jgi:glycosyltransferase involved in cell wall biosynthesis
MLRAPFGRLVAPRAIGSLAVSHFATDFLERLGFPRASIYPFGYFRAMPNITGSEVPNLNRHTEIVYVGELSPRKGTDLLLEAMWPLYAQHDDVSLAIIGDGPMMDELRTGVVAHGAMRRVTVEGSLRADQILPRLTRADLLVLPSRWDGWGMVVNEALAVGVPVIVSDRCGAADLVKHGINGYVFPSGQVSALRECLASFLQNRSVWPRLRSAAALTGRKISTELVAPYLVQCLRHMTGGRNPRPSAPWLLPPAG